MNFPRHQQPYFGQPATGGGVLENSAPDWPRSFHSRMRSSALLGSAPNGWKAPRIEGRTALGLVHCECTKADCSSGPDLGCTPIAQRFTNYAIAIGNQVPQGGVLHALFALKALTASSVRAHHNPVPRVTAVLFCFLEVFRSGAAVDLAVTGERSR